MPSTTTTRDWFLWLLSIVFLFAFVSFFVQSPGLVGRKGILPAYLVLQREAESMEDFVLNRPTILRLLPKLGLDLDLGLDFLCIGGMVASFASFISRDHRNALVIFLQWFFYLSLVQVGQIFLASKWDSLLLEVGFVAMLLAPLGLFGLNDIKSAVIVSQDNQSKSPLKFKFLKMTQNYRLPLWYVKWTLTRVIIADGATGLNNLFEGGVGEGGEDGGRWGFWFSKESEPFQNLLTANENQVLPTPFSWFVGCLPSWIIAMVTALHLISHFPVAFCVLSPWKQTRLAAFYWLVVTSVTTGLLGNQGFCPLLTIALSVTLVDDDWFYSTKQLITGRRRSSVTTSNPTTNGSILSPRSSPTALPGTSVAYKVAGVAVVAYVIALVYEVPHLSVLTENAAVFAIQALLAVLKVMKNGCRLITVLTGIVAACFLVSEIILAFQRQKMTMGCAFLKKMIIHIRFALLFTTTTTLFTCSLVPLIWNTDSTGVDGIAPSPLQSAYLWSHKHYRLVNNYASNYHNELAGQEGRREIVIEGSEDREEWREYHFLFKPSVSSRIPQIVVAHHPRLDESLWHAARSNYKQHTWILNLVYRLLNNQKEVIELFESNPFEDGPPNYVKADLYHYKFNYDLNGTSDWWTREWAGHYLPTLSMGDPSFVRYVSKSGLVEEDEEEERDMVWLSGCHGNNILASCLSFVRASLGQTSGSIMCLLLFLFGFLLSMVDPSRTTKYHVTMAPEKDHVVGNGVGGKRKSHGGMDEGKDGWKSGGKEGVKDGWGNGGGGWRGGKKGNRGSVIDVPIEILGRR